MCAAPESAVQAVTQHADSNGTRTYAQHAVAVAVADHSRQYPPNRIALRTLVGPTSPLTGSDPGGLRLPQPRP